MTHWTFIRRSLRHHSRAHLGVLLGATVGSAVLIGALLVGDSVRESLREMALERLGNIHLALATGDRLFRDELRPGISVHEGSNLHSAVLLVPGTATASDGSARANRVQVLGIGPGFATLARTKTPLHDIPADGVVLNQALADQLHAKVGENIVLRVSKISQISRDAPLSSQEDTSVALRLSVHAIASSAEFGRFSLQANQVAPFNAFVRLDQLQAKVNATNRANVLLLGTDKPMRIENVERFNLSLRQEWRLADAELELRELPATGEVELRTSRVFLDDSVVRLATNTFPGTRPLDTYFVNELRANDRATPYSMVTAAGAPIVPADMRDDEMLINQWLADDLRAKPGDEIEMKYFVVGTARKLEERTNAFRIRAVVPVELPHADRELMPAFPGLANAENCRDWDAGFPIDYDKMRPKDQKYWDDHKGTPKAFVTLAAGEKMWSNRFGTFTAVRFPLTPSLSPSGGEGARRAGEGAATASIETLRSDLEKKLLTKLDPATFGLVFQPVREQALKAAEQSQDFGGLFIGFSFFLIVAALLLMSLLFQFGIEQRTVEVGTLLALGFTPKQVRRLLLLEGAGIALLGGLLGTLGGIAYARVMLHGLTTIWRDAVGTSALRFHATPMTLVIGAVASVCVALFTIWLALRKQARQPAHELLSGGGEDYGGSSEPARVAPASRGLVAACRRNLGGSAAVRLWVAGLLMGLALNVWAMMNQESMAMAEAFFGMGALWLITALAGTSALLTKLNVTKAATEPTLSGMGARNIARRRKRSLATVAMLACGSFLIVSIGAFRLDENQNATKRESGTGGFALIGESTLPIHQDLNTKAGRDFYGLDEKALQGVAIVPFRVRDGDDASCLNLNRAQKPRLLGVKPELLVERGAFTFAGVAKGFSVQDGWRLLKGTPNSGSARSERETKHADLEIGAPPKDAIPAIADEASILWALGKKLGDTLDYTDERGRIFKVRLAASLANSILQGNLVIAEDEFVKRFPNESGYRMFLIDAPPSKMASVSASLTKSLSDVGLELTPAPRRLAAFNAVQNTYLSTFQILGGLGLLLGSVGLGVVVLRNVFERRGELALLLAVGFRPRALKWLVLSEHGALLLLGLASGVITAAVAVLPSLLSPAAQLPYASLAVTLGAVLFSGALWTWGATVLALRGNLLEALRNE